MPSALEFCLVRLGAETCRLKREGRCCGEDITEVSIPIAAPNSDFRPKVTLLLLRPPFSSTEEVEPPEYLREIEEVEPLDDLRDNEEGPSISEKIAKLPIFGAPGDVHMNSTDARLLRRVASGPPGLIQSDGALWPRVMAAAPGRAADDISSSSKHVGAAAGDDDSLKNEPSRRAERRPLLPSGP